MAKDADGQEFFELAELEDGLRRKTRMIVRSMVEAPAQNLDDVLIKLSIWREVKSPQGARMTGKTLYNHLAASAAEDVAELRERCTCHLGAGED